MKQSPSSFSRYELSGDEQISGMILNNMQLAMLQNERANIAEQKLNLIFDPNNVVDFAQQNAYLQGQLDLLQNLVDRSEESQKIAVAKAVEVARSQS